MKKHYLLGIFVFSFLNLFSQEEIEKDSIFEYEEMPHSIYVELGGHARYYSLNYERFLFDDFYFSPSIGGGVSYIFETPVINANVNFNQDFNAKHRMHIGLGISLAFPGWNFNKNIKDSADEAAIFYLGYKYSFPNSNWFYGITTTTFFDPNFTNSFFILPYGGLRLGYQFY